MTNRDRPESLEEFVENVGSHDWTLVTVNRTEPVAVQQLLERTFDDQRVATEELDLPDGDDDFVLLVEDGTVVAASKLEALEDSVLLVNSDLYRTGAKDVSDVDPPSVLVELEDTRFELRGYPESNTEKLLLVVISRYIERLAWRQSGGVLRSGFQRLSRLKDERGTRRVYSRLAEDDVDVHVYGVLDWNPLNELGVKLHAGTGAEYRDCWFVVYHSERSDAETAALLAVHRNHNEWRGMWTFDDETVRSLNRYLGRRL